MAPLSGSLETLSDLGVLLDVLIHKKDDFEEQRRVKRDDQTVCEQQPTAADAKICHLAISQKRDSCDTDNLLEVCTLKRRAESLSSFVLEDFLT